MKKIAYKYSSVFEIPRIVLHLIICRHNTEIPRFKIWLQILVSWKPDYTFKYILLKYWQQISLHPWNGLMHYVALKVSAKWKINSLAYWEWSSVHRAKPLEHCQRLFHGLSFRLIRPSSNVNISRNYKKILMNCNFLHNRHIIEVLLNASLISDDTWCNIEAVHQNSVLVQHEGLISPKSLSCL